MTPTGIWSHLPSTWRRVTERNLCAESHFEGVAVSRGREPRERALNHQRSNAAKMFAWLSGYYRYQISVCVPSHSLNTGIFSIPRESAIDVWVLAASENCPIDWLGGSASGEHSSCRVKSEHYLSANSDSSTTISSRSMPTADDGQQREGTLQSIKANHNWSERQCPEEESAAHD